jgi:hypothetical protein
MKQYVYFVKKGTGSMIIIPVDNKEEIKQYRLDEDYYEFFILK